VTNSVIRKGIDSAMNPRVGEISAPGFAASAEGGRSLCPMRFAQKARAAKMAMKMSRLQPARSPSFPMKILRIVDGCVGGMGSVGVRFASRLKGLPRVARVYLNLFHASSVLI
jgi:hypothetical protein